MTTIKTMEYDTTGLYHATEFEDTIHYIVDYPDDIVEYYLDIDIDYYVLDEHKNKDFSDYFLNGFFTTEITGECIDIFKNEVGHMFNDNIFKALYKAYDECKTYFENLSEYE